MYKPSRTAKKSKSDMCNQTTNFTSPEVVLNFGGPKPRRRYSRRSSAPDLANFSSSKVERRYSGRYNGAQKPAAESIKENPKPPVPVKKAGIVGHIDTTKTVLFVCSVILLILSFVQPSFLPWNPFKPSGMTTRQLLDELEKQLSDGQVEIKWDEQQIAELKEQVLAMEKSFGLTIEAYKYEENMLINEVSELGVTLEKVQEEFDHSRKGDQHNIVRLTSLLDNSYEELKKHQVIIANQSEEIDDLKALVANNCRVAVHDKPHGLLYDEEHRTPSGIVIRTRSDHEFSGSHHSAQSSIRGRK